MDKKRFDVHALYPPGEVRDLREYYAHLLPYTQTCARNWSRRVRLPESLSREDAEQEVYLAVWRDLVRCARNVKPICGACLVWRALAAAWKRYNRRRSWFDAYDSRISRLDRGDKAPVEDGLTLWETLASPSPTPRDNAVAELDYGELPQRHNLPDDTTGLYIALVAGEKATQHARPRRWSKSRTYQHVLTIRRACQHDGLTPQAAGIALKPSQRNRWK